jgi:trypsin
MLVLVGLTVIAVESRLLRSTGSNTMTASYLRSSSDNDKNRDLEIHITPRIVGGTDAFQGEFPFIVALYRTTDIYLDLEPVCGGSLITPNVVMTAAHCMGEFKRVEINRYKQSDDRDVDRYFSFELRINPDYNPKIVDYDVGLIKLPTPQLVATPISLATDETEIPSAMTVMGWGQLSLDGDQPDTLQQVSVNPVSQDQCQTAYNGFTITDRMFCAETPGKDACFGDSGGPAVIAGQNTQIGIVSWGIGCADGVHPGVYARVSALRGWIQDTVCNDLSPFDCVNGQLPNYAVAATSQPSSTSEAATVTPTTSQTSSPTYLVPTYAPSLQTSDVPSGSPSISIPTLSPSVRPTKKPTVNRSKCRDRQGLFFQLHESSKTTARKGCKWVAENTAERCHKLGDRFCPETCQVPRCQRSSFQP